MRRCALGLSLLFLMGCHGPADDFAKLDVADPALASGWVQFRHEPGGYAFQAPQTWFVDTQGDAQALIARTGSDANLFIRLLSPDAARKNDLVSFAVTRMAFASESELKVTNLDALAATSLKAMKANAPDAKHERLALAVGPAEHIWATMDGRMPDGSRQSVTTHLVVFATALRPFVVMYGYPTSKEAEYHPTLDAMMRSLRLILPKKDGRVQIPSSARAPSPPAFSGSVNPNAATTLGAAPSPPILSRPSAPAPIPTAPTPQPYEPPQAEPVAPPSQNGPGQTEPPAGGVPPTDPSTGGGGPTGDPGAVPPLPPSGP